MLTNTVYNFSSEFSSTLCSYSCLCKSGIYIVHTDKLNEKTCEVTTRVSFVLNVKIQQRFHLRSYFLAVLESELFHRDLNSPSKMINELFYFCLTISCLISSSSASCNYCYRGNNGANTTYQTPPCNGEFDILHYSLCVFN